MPQAQTIIRNDPTFPEWLNFEFLRKEGLSHVGKLSGKLWTDHNTHDPGITILEVLCYALTDLGYRNLFDIQDIFAQDLAERQAGTPDSNFFSPAEILSSNPLTVDDFRKMLLDIPGIRNAWLEKANSQEVEMYVDESMKALTFASQNAQKVDNEPLIITGLYNVLIDLEDFTPQYNANPNKAITQELVLNEVKKRLQAHRNLCEDFMNIAVMKPQNIHFCMELDLTANAIPEDVFVEIFEEIQKFLTPTIRFYTLQELLAKGKSVEEIFEGRPYSIDSHGFIDTDELKTLEPKDKLHVSDIHRILLNLPSKGVRAVRALTVSNDLSQENSWCLPMDKSRSPLINIDESTILYSKGALPIQFDKTIVKKKLNQRLANYYKNKRSLYELGFQIPQGIHRDFADYTSIQHEFPVVYGIGEGHLPVSEGPTRVRQALQLKGYLAFYDQLLANYLTQLANVRKLFALRSNDTSEEGVTFFSAPLNSMPDAEKVLRFFNSTDQGISDVGFGILGDDTRPAPDTQNPTALYLNQTLAHFEATFPNRLLCDEMMAVFQKAFNENTVVFELIDRWDTDPTVEECFRFFYILKLFSSDAQVLKSAYLFKTEQEANQNLAILKYLAALPQGYRRVDNNTDPDKIATYSFSIIYNPLLYKDYLQKIAESPDNFYERKEQFLSHLLARFAEQFTEYTLLMFALNPKNTVNDENEIIRDKKRFLNNYPSISRNRSKGFNYLNTEGVWNTDNTSGFEQRVAGYMGINDWQRRTLNHFKLAKSESAIAFSVKETYSGNIIWQSPLLLESFKALDCSILINNYLEKGICEIDDCYPEGTFTFRLVDKGGNTLLAHPHAYASAYERDEAAAFWKTLSEKEMVCEAEEDANRFIFIFKDAETDAVLLKSKKPYDSKIEAIIGFYKALQAAFIKDNYIQADKPPFYFTLKMAHPDASADETGIIAEHLERYESQGKSLEAADRLFQQISTNWLPFEVKNTEGVVRWHMADNTGKMLFESAINFKKYLDDAGKELNPQVFYACWEALNIIRQDNALQPVLDGKKYRIGLLKSDTPSRLFLDWDLPQNWVVLGRSVEIFETENAALEGLETFKTHLLSLLLEQILIKNTDGKYQYQLIFPNENYPIMASRKTYDTQGEALMAFSQFIELAKEEKNYNRMDNVKVLESDRVDDFRFEIDKNGIWAATYDSYTSAAIRNTVLTDTAAKIKDLEAILNPSIFDEGDYYISINSRSTGEQPLPLLVGTKRYETQAAAYADAQNFFSIIKNELKQTQETLSDDTIVYSIQVGEGADKQAEHFQTYLKEQDRDAVYNEIASLTILPDDWILPDVKYRFVLKYANCTFKIQHLLRGSELFDTAEEACEKGETYIKNLQKDCKLNPTTGTILEIKDNHLILKQCVGNKVVGATPSVLGTHKDKIYDFIKKPMDCAWDAAAQIIPEQADYPSKEVKGGDRIRLRDDAYQIARYVRSFESAERRDAELALFSKDWNNQIKAFPQITAMGYGETTNKGNRAYFKFDFTCGLSCITLRTGQLYGSGSEAIETNTPKMLDFIQLLNDYDAYRIERVGSKCFLKIYDYLKPIELNTSGKNLCSPSPNTEGGALLQVLTPFNSEKAARCAIKDLIEWARTFPVYKDLDDDKIYFRLVNTDPYADLPTLWISTTDYANRQEAYAAFEEFLRLIAYPANIIRLSDPLTFALGEILLEADSDYKLAERMECQAEYGFTTEQRAWRTDINLLLKHINADYAIQIFDKDTQGGVCNHSFRVVDDAYRVAVHPVKYDNPIQRTRAQNQLWSLFKCQNKYQDFINKTVIKIMPPKTPTPITKVNEVTKEVVVIGQTTEYPFIDWKNIVWNITVDVDTNAKFLSVEEKKQFDILVEKIITGKTLTSDEKDLYELLKMQERLNGFVFWAEHREFYQSQQANGKYWLRLIDEDGTEIAITNDLKKIENQDAATIETILKAREHPYKAVRPTRKGDFMQFQYRIYCRDWQNVVSEAPVEHIQGAYIWESVTLFNSTEDVRVALDGHFLKVVVLSQNYQTAQESDCGRFLVELVDSQSIIAYYPAAFPSRQAAQKGAERMLHAVNVEGFHLIEHILLRPQEKNQADTILLNLDPTLTTLWDDTFIDEADKSSDKLTKAAVYKTFVTNNLPGKDPYSAQLTVFLPYWSKRFQNERFRDFFENTLQREVPAHCLLRTVWLTPEDMCRFEMQYRTWLEALSNGEDEPEKKALIQQIAAQASVFDDAILSGSSKNYGVHLDKIQLVDAPKLKI